MRRHKAWIRWITTVAIWLLTMGLAPVALGSSHTFTITSPTSSSVWYPGSTVTITWTGGSPMALINLTLADVSAWTVVAGIASGIPNTGSFTWTVPLTTPPGTYLVYIEDVGQTTWTYGPEFPIKKADGKPDLTITKKPEGALQAGGTGAYQVVVSNIGSGPAPGPIIVTDTLGLGLTYLGASGAGWTCSASGSTVTCTHPGPVPAGGSLPPITIHVAVAKDAQKVENCARVRMEQGSDANPTNDTICIGTPVKPPATGSICGSKWDDKDGDGIRDLGEPGLSGWTIALLDSAGNLVATVVTGSNGEYCFKGVAMGTYTVVEVGQPGWYQSYPSASSGHGVTLSGGIPNVKGFDFGNFYKPQPGTICGIKFLDKNENGVQDPSEPGLSNWVIQMTDAAGNVVATAVSGQGGKFCFENVKPGTYTFGELMTPNWTQTTPAAPGTYTITVQPGQNGTLLIFGNRPGQDPCCLTFRYVDGHSDMFATTNGLEPASPSAALLATLPGTTSAIFDGTQMDRFFAHTMQLPAGNCIRSARLDMRVRPLGMGSLVANDTISLRFTGVTGSPTWGSYFGSGNSSPGLLPNPWTLSGYGAGQWISLDLASLPGSVNLLATLQTQRFIDVVIQDDTAVDVIHLTVEFCECEKKAGVQ